MKYFVIFFWFYGTQLLSMSNKDLTQCLFLSLSTGNIVDNDVLDWLESTRNKIITIKRFHIFASPLKPEIQTASDEASDFTSQCMHYFSLLQESLKKGQPIPYVVKEWLSNRRPCSYIICRYSYGKKSPRVE